MHELDEKGSLKIVNDIVTGMERDQYAQLESRKMQNVLRIPGHFCRRDQDSRSLVPSGPRNHTGFLLGQDLHVERLPD